MYCRMCLTAEHVYSDHRSLGLPLCRTSGGLGGWGVRHDFLAVWSAGMISSAINTLMALEESGPFLSHLFIVTNPSWVLRDPLASSLLVPGQILV